MKSERDIYPIELIKTGVNFLMFTNASRNAFSMRSTAIRSLLLYQLLNVDGKWLPINRDYKPIGLTGGNEWADYSEYPFLLIPEDRINFDFLMEEGSHKNSFKEGRYFFLFNDFTYPRDIALKRRYQNSISKTFKNQ